MKKRGKVIFQCPKELFFELIQEFSDEFFEEEFKEIEIERSNLFIEGFLEKHFLDYLL